MTVIEEGKLKFSFDDNWTVINYDDVESEYKKRIDSSLKETKAVDFIGIHKDEGNNKKQYFIEVKDFTGSEIKDKKKITSGELPTVIAHKVRDTLAGLVGIWKTTTNKSQWQEHIRLLLRAQSSINIVFLIKSLPLGDPRKKKNRIRRKNEAQVLQSAIKKQLKWLSSDVWVAEVESVKIPGIVVENLSHSNNG